MSNTELIQNRLGILILPNEILWNIFKLVKGHRSLSMVCHCFRQLLIQFYYWMPVPNFSICGFAVVSSCTQRSFLFIKRGGWFVLDSTQYYNFSDKMKQFMVLCGKNVEITQEQRKHYSKEHRKLRKFVQNEQSVMKAKNKINEVEYLFNTIRYMILYSSVAKKIYTKWISKHKLKIRKYKLIATLPDGASKEWNSNAQTYGELARTCKKKMTYLYLKHKKPNNAMYKITWMNHDKKVLIPQIIITIK